MLAGASRKIVGCARASTNEAPPSRTTKTGSEAGSVTWETPSAPVPSVTSAAAPSATALRAIAAAVLGEAALSRTCSRILPRPVGVAMSWSTAS